MQASGHISRQNQYCNVGRGNHQPGRYTKAGDNQHVLAQSSEVGRQVLSHQSERCEKAKEKLREKIRKREEQQEKMELPIALAAISITVNAWTVGTGLKF